LCHIAGANLGGVTGIGHQFITLTVDICVQRGGRASLRRAGLSAAAETCVPL